MFKGGDVLLKGGRRGVGMFFRKEGGCSLKDGGLFKGGDVLPKGRGGCSLRERGVVVQRQGGAAIGVEDPLRLRERLLMTYERPRFVRSSELQEACARIAEASLHGYLAKHLWTLHCVHHPFHPPEDPLRPGSELLLAAVPLAGRCSAAFLGQLRRPSRRTGSGVP